MIGWFSTQRILDFDMGHGEYRAFFSGMNLCGASRREPLLAVAGYVQVVYTTLHLTTKRIVLRTGISPVDVRLSTCSGRTRVCAGRSTLNLCSGRPDEIILTSKGRRLLPLRRRGVPDAWLAEKNGRETSSQALAAGACALFSPRAHAGRLPFLRSGVQILPALVEETAADEIGLTLMAEAGYDPRAAIDFWRRMAAKSAGRQPPAFLSTHPAPTDRIARLEGLMPKALEIYRASRRAGQRGRVSPSFPLSSPPLPLFVSRSFGTLCVGERP